MIEIQEQLERELNIDEAEIERKTEKEMNEYFRAHDDKNE